MVLLELRGRVWDVMAGDPQRRGLEVLEAALGDARDHFGGDSRLAGGLVRHDHPTGLAHGRGDRVVVDG